MSQTAQTCLGGTTCAIVVQSSSTLAIHLRKKHWRRSKPNSCNKTSELVDSIQETADLCVQLQEEEVSIQCSLQSAQPANLPSAS